MKTTKNLIGAHVSIAGGFYKAIDEAEHVGANCIQIFTKSNRQWQAKPITQQSCKQFLDREKSSPVQIVVAHASYLINLGSTNDETVKKSISALSTELERCETLKIPYLVLHPGTTRFKDNEKKSLEFIAQGIDKAFDLSKTKHTMLLLETMAGQGSMLGSTFEQLATMLHSVHHKKRVGVCFDTCHAFVAGYEFDTPVTYKKMWENFDDTIGISKLKAFHINDSKKPLGSHVDRHEHILKGKIPQEAFSLLLNDANFKTLPKLLETPKTHEHDDQKNIETLKSLIK